MRIIIADHHATVLRALKTLLRETPEIEEIGETDNSQSLLTQAENNFPDLILVDMELPGEPIADLITNLHSLKPKPIVVVMSIKPENGRFMLKAGADALVSKSDNPDWLLATLLMYEKR